MEEPYVSTNLDPKAKDLIDVVLGLVVLEVSTLPGKRMLSSTLGTWRLTHQKNRFASYSSNMERS